MADGNMGSLYTTLGIRDEMTKTLRKIVSEMKGVDEETQKAKRAGWELMRSLNNINADNFSKVFKNANRYIEENAKGVSGIISLLKSVESKNPNILTEKFLGAKNLNEVSSMLNAINVELARAAKLAKEAKKSEQDGVGGKQGADIAYWQGRISNALKYIGLLQEVNILQDKISATKSDYPNVNTKKLEEAKRSVEAFKTDVAKMLAMGGVDGSNVLSGFMDNFRKISKGVRQTLADFSKENPLSALTGVDKIHSTMSDIEKLQRKMQSLMEEGGKKGFDTSMFGDNIAALKNRLTEFERVLNKDTSRMSDTNYMRGLYSNTAADMTLARNAMTAYRQERDKVLAQDKEAASEYDRQKRQREASKAAQDAELKAMSDYAKRYMELQEAKRKADEKASAETEKNARKMSELYASLGVAIEKTGKVAANGIRLNVDTTRIKNGLAAAEDLMNRLSTANPSTIGRNGNASLADYTAKVKEMKRELDSAASSQKELNNAQVKANRELAQAEKQRQTEIKNTESRYDSLGNKVRQLRAEYSKGISVGADVSKAEAEIHRLISIMRQLQDIKGKLSDVDWRANLGQLGGIGSGHDTTLANRALQDQKAVNQEAQRGVNLERQRQEEIARSGAKVRAELVRGFERANSHAGKLNSTVQDLKSLFLQGGLVYGARQFAMSIITTGGEMEKQHIALQSILGDMQNANTMFNQVKDLALNSPFTFSELNRDVKQLAAYGVEYNQLYDTTKRLADMSSGLGVSFDRIALAFGQVQARGWLDGKELRQIAYAGIPLLSKLSEFYSKREGKNVSTSEIKTRISKREVSFDDVKSIFWEMTDAGGQFYNMQQTLSETLLGRYNKLKDAWEIMLADFADGKSVVGGTFKFILDQVTNLVQALHTFTPVVLGLFSGFALKKTGTLLAGSAASNFLTNKEKIAQDIKARALSGQQLSAVEQRILATKKQITREDLQALVAAKAITKTELQRLFLSGKISKEMYKQVVTQAGMNGFWTNFANKGGVAITLLGKGIGSVFSSLWTMIGGLPGLLITAVSMGVGYAISKYQALSRAIEQTQDELKDRRNQIGKFLQESSVSAAINSGDTKAIDNLIEAYKDKLKELAPYNFNNLVMRSEEEKSHAKRLQYLESELKLLKAANEEAANKMSSRGYYSDLEDVIKDAYEKLQGRSKMRAAAMNPNASQGDKDLYANEKAYGNYIEKLKDTLAKKFGNIGKDEKMREAAQQAMSGIFSELGVPEDKADMIRASVLQAFGCGGKSSWLQGEVANDMMTLISTSFPLIGEKIKASIPLNDAEKAKVAELMDDAKNGLISKYPELERTLQGMLDKSRFKAVIELVVGTTGKLNETQSEIVGRIPSMLQGETLSKYISRAEEYGKDNSFYGARNTAKTNIDNAYNNLQSAIKSKSKQVKKLRQEYLDEKQIAKTLLNYDYDGEGKKSNKPGKNGRQEDKELKALQERLSSLKSARQMYQKYQPYMSDELAKKKTLESFPEVAGLNLDNYQEAVRSLLKGVSINTTERKKFQTSVYREVAEWLFEEKDKKEFEEKAATFTEEMNRLSDRWDLYKSILEKTGNKNFAQSAWIDAFQMDEKAQSLMDEYYAHYGKVFNMQDALSMTDGEAKKKLKLPNEYEEWKKIVDLLRNNYVQALNDGADAMQQTMSVAQKLDSVTKKYDKKRKDAGDNQDLKERYDFLEKQEKSGIIFDQLKSEINWDGVFGNLDNYTKKELKKIRKQIKNLVAGGILDGMSTTDLSSFYNGMNKLNEAIDGQGYGGLASLIKEMRETSQQYDDAVKAYNDAVKKYGEDSWQAEQAKKTMQAAEDRKRTSQGSVRTKKDTLFNSVLDIANMFATLGKGDGSGSTLLSNAGSWTTSIMKSFGGNKAQKNSEKIGSAIGMFAGLTEAIGEKGFGGFLSDAFEDIGNATNSVFKDLFGINLGIGGADYSGYNEAKAEYENLINVWDTLISKKKQYMSEHWGTEAENASAEALKLLNSEIEQTKILAKDRLGTGTSLGSHSIWYRMWKGSYGYNGKNWQDVAGEISSKYGVKFSGMEDMVDMSAEVLEKIKTDYSGLWAHMDSDFKDYLEKLIEYGDQADEMIESLTEKLTGNKFSDLVSSWGDAMASMSNSSDNLVEHFEDNLKKTILNSMIENVFSDDINALLKKSESYAKNNDKVTTSGGKVLSNYTAQEYADIKSDTEALSDNIEAYRDYLKRLYGWSDDSSSSSTNSVKSITEDTADIIVSYINSMRADLSVVREMQASFLPEMSEIAKSQLTQLNLIAQNTLRNADAAERIETIFIEYNDNFNKVLNGTKSLSMK